MTQAKAAVIIAVATKKIAETEAVLAANYQTMPTEMYVRLVTAKARFEWAIDEVLRRFNASSQSQRLS